MLSVMIYEPDEARRSAMSRALMQVPGAAAALRDRKQVLEWLRTN